MRRSLALSSLLWGLAAAAAAQTPSPPEGLVWMVLRDINEVGFDRGDPMNRPPLTTMPPDGMIQAVDVSPDGRADWLVDYQAAALTPFCGTGGCVKRLYVSTDDGYVRALDSQAFTLTVRPDHQVETWVHRIYCAGSEDECRYRFAWDDDGRRLEPVWSSSARPGVDGGYAPLDPEED